MKQWTLRCAAAGVITLAGWILLSLRAIEKKLERISEQEGEQMANLTRLQADVANLKTVSDSAVTLIKGLADEIRNAGTDQAALDALADSIEAQSSTLADAVTANTPAAVQP